MGKKNKSRSARRTGSPVGDDEGPSSEDYEITEEIYEVECVVGHRMRRTGMEYKVRWRGWSEQFDEWLHNSKMDCPDAIKEYWDGLNHAKANAESPEKDGSRKRERASSPQTLSSRKNDSSPPVKRSCPADNDATANCETSPKEPVTETTPKPPLVNSSSKKKKKNKLKPNNLTVEPILQFRSGALEESASDGDSPPAAASISFDVDGSVSPCASVNSSTHSAPPINNVSALCAKDGRGPPAASASSSTHFIPPLVIKRQIPRPPVIPKRKVVESLSSTTTSTTTPSVSGTSLESGSSSIPKTSGDDTSMPQPQCSDVAEKKAVDTKDDLDSFSSTPGTSNNVVEPTIEKKQSIRPHGFERGLTVERIHGFFKRADRMFAVVQFKHCDVVEILATQILQHYEPLALVRGFEDHHIRCRRNEVLASSPKPPES